MKPYYEHAGITIFHGDCRDVMEELEGLRMKSFDLLLTDPPYGLGERWSGGTWASDPMYADAKKWDAETFPDGDLVHLLRFSASAIIWGGNCYRLPPSRCWLAWVKPSIPTMADFELAWTNLDKPSKSFLESRNSDGKRVHPTQKPDSLMAWCLAMAGSPRTVLDTFMGSGTTLEVAKRVGIKAVGIDINEKYCEIAAKRLSQDVLPLMDLEPERTTPLDLFGL